MEIGKGRHKVSPRNNIKMLEKEVSLYLWGSTVGVLRQYKTGEGGMKKDARVGQKV